MAVTKQKKEEVFGKLQGALANAQSVVFVKTKGLPVIETQGMRTKLSESGVSYYVAKKTLIKRALAEKNFTGTLPPMDGELAIAWGTDLVAPAREVQDFVKSTKEKVKIVGGVFEGRYMNAVEMTEIATIPSQHTLYAQFVMLINSPIQQFVMALDQIAQKKESNA
jgi:large subunit ribosomal protein L10